MENFSKFLLTVGGTILIGWFLIHITESKTDLSQSETSSLSHANDKTTPSEDSPLPSRKKLPTSKIIEGAPCYQYEGDSRWWKLSSQGVEMVWDESLKYFRIDRRDENGRIFARNPDGKAFHLKEGKWTYHDLKTDLRWRIDPDGLFYLPETHGKHVTESGRIYLWSFRGWVADDGPKIQGQRFQWFVDANGYYLSKSYTKQGYEGVVLPNGVELRWKGRDFQTLELLQESRAARSQTWLPRPLGQISWNFSIDPQELYKKLLDEESTSVEFSSLQQKLSSLEEAQKFEQTLEKVFQISIDSRHAQQFTPHFLICLALSLDCYPRNTVSEFLTKIECVPMNDAGGKAYPHEKRIEMKPPLSSSPAYLQYLISTFHHEIGHQTTLVPSLGFPWNLFRKINPGFVYRKPTQDPFQALGIHTAYDYGMTNEKEDVATIIETFMTDPNSLALNKSAIFFQKYHLLTQFYNQLFQFQLNPDFARTRGGDASVQKWVALREIFPHLPPIEIR